MKPAEKGVWVGCDVSGCVDLVEGSGDLNSGICGGTGLRGTSAGMDWAGKAPLEPFWPGDACTVGGMLWTICCWSPLDGPGLWEDMGILCMIFPWEWCWRACRFCACRALVPSTLALRIAATLSRVWALSVGPRLLCVCPPIMCRWLATVWRFCCCKAGVVNCLTPWEKNHQQN